MQAGDPRADPSVVDLIELAGLWLAADDRGALDRTLERLCDLIQSRYPTDEDFFARFEQLRGALKRHESIEELRRRYRRATVG